MLYQSYTSQENHLVAVDCVIFGYEEEELKLLLFQRQLEPEIGKWSLVGGWLNKNESAETAAVRVLTKTTGLNNIFMEQVQVFSKPERDPGGRVISIVFYALIDIKKYDKSRIDKYGASWFPVSKLPTLIFDHNDMFKLALEKLQNKASYVLVGRDLLPNEFTITQLRKLYNSIFSQDFDPGNFRKKILSLHALEKLESKDYTESKKGAFFYLFKNEEDIDVPIRIIKYEKSTSLVSIN